MRTIKNSSAIVILPLLLFYTAGLYAQKPSTREKQYFRQLRQAFAANNAYQTVGFVEQRWRLAGNTGFNESIYYVEKVLQQAGYVQETNGEQDAVLTYRIEKRPMQRPTWEPLNAQLFIEGENKPLLEFITNRNMLATFSGSTGPSGVIGELIDLGKATDKELEGRDFTGKIIMADGGIGSVYTKAVKGGALGALAYSLPGYTQPRASATSPIPPNVNGAFCYLSQRASV